MKNRFSIGQMSQLHNIPIKTLRYYDEIGLFTPAEIDPGSRYRYYSTEQFEQLNTINYLKTLGVSLKEIKTLLDLREIDHFLQLLKQQKEITENKIRELERVRDRFENRIAEIEKARTIKERGVVRIQELPERKIVRLQEKICSEQQLELSLRKLENMTGQNSSIFIGKVGLTVSSHHLKKGEFTKYNSIFLVVEEEGTHDEFVSTLPEGEYACVYYNGDHSASPAYYAKMLDYIETQGYEISGDSVERTIIDQFISRHKEDYLTEIQIPVKKLTLQQLEDSR